MLAGLTRGFSGAELANVLNEAALLAARRSQAQVSMSLIEEAIDRTTLGTSSRRHIMTEEERRITAYHEAGHALVAQALPGASVPHRLTIAPRGDVLGHCTMLDRHDFVLQTRSALLGLMAALLGGRAAEELVVGEPISTAAEDLRQVNAIARRMVCELGMSETLGPAAYVSSGDGQHVSEEAARAVLAEVRRLVDEAYGNAREVLEGARSKLDLVAQSLLERETLTADDLARLTGPTPPAVEAEAPIASW